MAMSLATAPRSTKPAANAFYPPSRCCPDESVSYLMKRVLASFVQQAELALEPHAVTHAHWHPLFKLSAEGELMAAVVVP